MKITDESLFSNSSIKSWYDLTKNPEEDIEDKLSNVLVSFGFKLCTFDKLLTVINNDHNVSTKIPEITSKNILLFFKNKSSLVGLNIQDTPLKTADSLLTLLEFCKYKNENIYEELNDTSLLLNISNKLVYNNKYGIDKNDAVHVDLIDMYESCDLPILEEAFIGIMKSFVIDLKKVDDILISINLVSHHHQDRIKKIDRSIRNKFISYLNNGLINTENKKLFYSTIIFENVFGEILSIENKDILTLDSKIPIDGIQKIFCSKNFFINSKPGQNLWFDSFYKQHFINSNYSLGGKNLWFDSFYKEYIKSLDVLSFEQKFKHILAIREYYTVADSLESFNRIEQGLLENLKIFKFIKSNEMSEMFNASHFYDSRNAFFKILFKDNHDIFPHSPYDEAEWQKFLLHIGLKSDSEIKSNLIHYLDKVRTHYQSKIIEFTELIDLFNNLFKFVDIKAVGNKFLNSLGFLIISIKNNTNVENVEKIKSIMLRVYEIISSYFQTIQCKNNQDEYLKRLSNMDIIFHEYKSNSNSYRWKLSRIDEFILSGLKESDEIGNLIYSLPIESNSFKDLFFALGLHKEIDYKLCVKLLAKIHDKMKNEDKPLLREQSLKVMNLLFKNSFETEKKLDNEKLYLLNDNYELVETSKLYYIDKYNLNYLYSHKTIKSSCLISLEAFSSTFQEYKKFNNSWSKANVLIQLDQQHHLKPISHYIKSELIKSENLEIKSNIELENKVKSQAFFNSIISLLNIETHDLDFMKKFFTNIKIHDTKNLKT